MKSNIFAPADARNFAADDSTAAGGFAEASAGFHHDASDNSSFDSGTAAEGAPAPASLALDALMRSSAVKQLLACEPGGRPVFAVDRDLFERRRYNHLAAKAAMRDLGTIDDDVMTNRCDAALEIAELLLLATPAALPFQAWVKFEVLEEAISESLRDGERAAPRLLMALASFKSDLARFLFGDGERI